MTKGLGSMAATTARTKPKAKTISKRMRVNAERVEEVIHMRERHHKISPDPHICSASEFVISGDELEEEASTKSQKS